jgi:hypothetical protein
MLPSKRVAIVVPAFDQAAVKVVSKRAHAWSKSRAPCLDASRRPSLDLVFYGEQTVAQNLVSLLSEDVRQCFSFVRVIPAPSDKDFSGSKEKLETYAFYRLFKMQDMKTHYDVFFWMHPHVLQVRAGWASKIYEQAVLSESFWVRGSAAMQTCPASALTADGDCDGSVNQAFPAVLHININALYSLHDDEFQALLDHAEQRHAQVAPDVALFEELVSTDHPLALKLGKGMRRKLHSVQVHHRAEDPAVSVARGQPGHHVTSLYWAAHAHQYQHTDFIINAVAGKKHLRQEIKAGSHPNTYFVNEHIGS